MKFASLSSGSEFATADLLRRTVQSVDPLLPVLELRTFEKHMDGNPQLWIVRAGAALFSIFGGTGAGPGGRRRLWRQSVFGRAADTRDRNPDGARRGAGTAVLRLIMGESAIMLLSGIALGFVLAAATGKILSGIL